MMRASAHSFSALGRRPWRQRSRPEAPRTESRAQAAMRRRRCALLRPVVDHRVDKGMPVVVLLVDVLESVEEDAQAYDTQAKSSVRSRSQEHTVSLGNSMQPRRC
eukprot:6187829-Pleurochrysis_carterae.AAC.1